MKKIISVLLVLCLITGICTSQLSVSAKTVEKSKITVGTVSAVSGDTVVVPITMIENPGIMALTVSITYDSDILEYVSFYIGEIVYDYMVVDHPDKNLIRFVSCERQDKTANGALIRLKFKVKDTAEAGLTPISIEYSAGDFCNYNLDKIMPEIVPGGIDVAYNGSNCKHKSYGEWTIAAEPSCEENGAEQRICKTCGHIELRDTDPIGHIYSDTWTVDRPATAEQDGIMTRYCIRCDDYVDRITFSLAQSDEGGFENEVNATVPVNKFTESIFKEQYPDRELTSSKAPSGNASSNSNDEGEASDGDLSHTGGTDSSSSENSDNDRLLQKAEEAIPSLGLILKFFKAALIALAVVLL